MASLGVELPGLMAPMRFGLQVAAGCMLGLRTTRAFWRRLRRYAGPAAVVSVWAVLTGVAGGFALYAVTGVSRPTALLAATPGGITEMTLSAGSLGADPTSVALLQLARLVAVMVTVPLLVGARQQAAAGADRTGSGEHWHSLWLLLPAAAAGYALTRLRLPAGALIGAMLFTTAYACRGRGALTPFPRRVTLGVQLGVGMLVGLSFTRDTLARLRELALPALVITLVMLGSGVVLGRLLHAWTGWDLVTCLLASAPAGITQMGVLGEALDANVAVVGLLHLIRLLTVVAVLLPLLGWLL